MPNDILEIHLPREIPSVNLIPYARKLEVLYEDAFIIIVTNQTIKIVRLRENILMKV